MTFSSGPRLTGKRGEPMTMATDRNPQISVKTISSTPHVSAIHPAWLKLIEFCRVMGFGELERVKIQDGVPTVAEVVKERVKLL